MGRLAKGAAALLLLGAALAGTAALPARQAAAQTTGGVFGAGNGPIDISADELEVIDAENKAVWKGNVEALQGQSRMRAPALTVFFARSNSAPAQAGAPGAGWGGIQRMEAEGPVYYVTAQQNARGDRAVYEAAANAVTMTGNVVLMQDKNVVQGDRLVIDTRTNHATLYSNSPARSKRVRGVFYPSSSQSGPSTPAARP